MVSAQKKKKGVSYPKFISQLASTGAVLSSFNILCRRYLILEPQSLPISIQQHLMVPSAPSLTLPQPSPEAVAESLRQLEDSSQVRYVEYLPKD
jgi:hypothetical protein